MAVFDDENTQPNVATEKLNGFRGYLAEAWNVTMQARAENYGHPILNFCRIAQMWNAQLGGIMMPGKFVNPVDVALMMIQVKVARQSFSHKDDNMVDIAGYVNTIYRMDEWMKEHDFVNGTLEFRRMSPANFSDFCAYVESDNRASQLT